MDKKESPKQKPTPKENESNIDNLPEQHDTSTSQKKPTLDLKNNPKKLGIIIGAAVLALILIVIVVVSNSHSYEQYDLKGLTIKEACQKARGAGWKVDGANAVDFSDKTDCYNTEKIVTDYYYYESDKSVSIYFGEKKTEEQKKEECEAKGNWYRDGQCKSQEEWETHYKWQDAHQACKKYGPNAYAKSLTDCYVGNDYKGTVDGEPAAETPTPAETPSSTPAAEEPTSSTTTTETPSSGGYEAIYNEYAAKLRAQCPTLSMMECAELSNEGVEKMADYMWRATGVDGQYETYSAWADKLFDIYMEEAR